MTKELHIPTLHNLIKKGQTVDEDEQDLAIDQGVDLHIEDDESAQPTETSHDGGSVIQVDEDISGYNSIQELLIEEEIRVILDKHMENAYEDIIRLINHKLAEK